MALQADLLESIPQTRYLSAESYISYRAIMRIFYLEYQKMHYQLDKDTILSLLHEDPLFVTYTAEQLISDLDQLVKWKNLTPIQDPHKAYTIADFKNRQFQYMMTEAALEVERMTITLENLYMQTTGLSSSAFRRIQAALHTAEHLEEMSLKDVGEWWQELQEDFRRLRQNHQDYLREFYGPSAEKQMKSAEFIAYKQHLIRYLEDFIQDLQSSAAQISAQLETFTDDQIDRILTLVYQSALEIPRPHSEQTPLWQEELRQKTQGVWQSLMSWFIGQDSTARQVMDVTNEVIRRVVQNAAILVQMQNMGVSNKAELRHLMILFASIASIEDAHRLSALVFGVQQCRHFTVNAERDTERIDLSAYEEPPMEYSLQPRVRTYKPRMDRSGFADKSAEKAAQRQKILEEDRQLREKIMQYIRDGKLDFAALSEPVPPEVRTVFLSWVAMANLAPDGYGHTQYGQRFALQKRGNGTCNLICTDGILTMPDCTLVFEGNAHG